MFEPATVGVSVVFVVVLLAVVSSLDGASLVGAELRLAPRRAELDNLAVGIENDIRTRRRMEGSET